MDAFRIEMAFPPSGVPVSKESRDGLAACQRRGLSVLICLLLAGCVTPERPELARLQPRLDAPAYPTAFSERVVSAPVSTPAKTTPFLLSSTGSAPSQRDLTVQIGEKIAAITAEPGSSPAVSAAPATASTFVPLPDIAPVPVTPVKKAEPVAAAPKMTIGAGETVDMALTRWGGALGKVNVMYDVSPEIRAELECKRDATKAYESTFDASVAKLSEELAQRSPKLRFWVSQTPTELIVHDIGPRTDVRSHLVNQSTLRDAATAVVREIGWKTIPDSWTTATPNYRLSAPYRMVVSGDVIRTMEKLLAGYNVQAQFDKSTRTVYFTPMIKG